MWLLIAVAVVVLVLVLYIADRAWLNSAIKAVAADGEIILNRVRAIENKPAPKPAASPTAAKVVGS